MAKMINIGISVEGQTEGFFVQYVLAKYMRNYGVELSPPLIMGGNINIERVAKNLSLLATQYDYVTSMYDFYGFQGKYKFESKNHLLGRVIRNLSPLASNKVIFPYIQMYEFEALLFSDPKILCEVMFKHSNNQKHKEKCLLYFEDILASRFPEQVNDSIQTAPSKRIKKINHRYKKTLFGHIITRQIGINKIRSRCKGFNKWIEYMINLAKQSNKAY